MTRLQAPVARLVGSLFTAVALVALVAGCGSRSRELQPGSYRAVLELPGGELPFELDVAQEEAAFVLTVINGEERVRVTDVSVTDGQLHGHDAGLHEHADRPHHRQEAPG